ncbi:hypothetical protein [Sinobacterium caligoides]|uniref:hypothetical protein n=1 Tax=Sinobacterium caligoides TaxID=933926 RepID=UPI0013C35880|nr:hypothetical protein [Sinobacterium caligoides]
MNKSKRLKLVAILATAAMLCSCNGYTNLNIHAPFNIGGIYFDPSIGVGSRL